MQHDYFTKLGGEKAGYPTDSVYSEGLNKISELPEEYEKLPVVVSKD